MLALAEELWPRETPGRSDEEEGAVIANEDLVGAETAEKAGNERMKRALATHAIEAAWSLSKWTHMEDYLKYDRSDINYFLYVILTKFFLATWIRSHRRRDSTAPSWPYIASPIRRRYVT